MLLPGGSGDAAVRAGSLELASRSMVVVLAVEGCWSVLFLSAGGLCVMPV